MRTYGSGGVYAKDPQNGAPVEIWVEENGQWGVPFFALTPEGAETLVKTLLLQGVWGEMNSFCSLRWVEEPLP